jgi:hypothetical protein
MAAGSHVVVVGDYDLGSTHITSGTGHVGAEVARNVMVVEHFVSALANWDGSPDSRSRLTTADLDGWSGKHHEGRRI